MAACTCSSTGSGASSNSAPGTSSDARSGTRAAGFYDALLERLSRHPGVSAAAITLFPPLTGNENVWNMRLPAAGADIRIATPDTRLGLPAGDARRVTAVLSGAPQAAVRGPSPIVRAFCARKGRQLRSRPCLQILDVLRTSDFSVTSAETSS